MTTETPGRGRPKGPGHRERMDAARLDLHDAADAIARLDAALADACMPLRAPARVICREAWASLLHGARALDTATHLPRIAS